MLWSYYEEHRGMEYSLCDLQSGWNILHHACAGGSLEVLEWLVESMDRLYTDMLNQKSKVCIKIAQL